MSQNRLWVTLALALTVWRPFVARSQTPDRQYSGLNQAIQFLNSPDWKVRLVGTSNLSSWRKAGDRHALRVHLLSEMLRNDPVAQVRRAAANALSSLGEHAESYPVLVEAFKEDESAEVRSAAADTLCQFKKEHARLVPLYLHALKTDPSARVRMTVLDCLIRSAPEEEVVPALLGVMKSDPRKEMRIEAVQAVLTLKTRNTDVVPAIREAMKDRAPIVGVNAAGVLAELDPTSEREVVAYLTRALAFAKERPQELSPVQVVRILNGIGPAAKSAIPLVAAMLREDVLVISPYAGVEFLSKVEATSELIELLKSAARPEVRGSSAGALGEIKTPKASVVAALHEATKDSDPEVRVVAALWLAEQNPEYTSLAVTILIESLKERKLDQANADGTCFLLMHLKSLGPRARSAAPAMIEWLGHPQTNVRILALESIAQSGNDDEVVIYGLAAAAAHANWRAQIQAANGAFLGLVIPLLTGRQEREEPGLATHLADLRNAMWSNMGTRTEAARQLSIIGAKAKAAEPLLEMCLWSKHAGLRHHAEEALQKIRGAK